VNAPALPPSTFDGLEDTFKAAFIDATTRVLSATFFSLGFSFRYEGNRNVPRSGPILAVANHQSFLDPPAIGVAFERRLIYLARKSLFKNRFFAGWIRGLNAVPIDQKGIGKEGLQTILGQLRLGKAVLVFPEGSRTRDGTMQELRPGVHLLIKRSPAPIVPVGIAGAYDAWPAWRKVPLPSPLFLPPTPRTIAVSIGRPLDPRRFAQMPRDRAMAALAEEMAQIQVRAERLRRK
jgi:1-acyl-sn-glycerol-3-phosphate acyltransferase